jgi:quercetin dioxygenase-like cupin family protein
MATQDEKKQPQLRFRHLDGEKWQEVRAIEIDGRRASVREKWLDFTPAFLSLYAEWDPGMMVHKHGHNSDHVVYVIDGEMTCGDVVCKAGMHITLEKGAVFGPFVAGPQGVKLFEVMMGDPRSFAADPEGWKKLLAEKKARQLPNPPIDMPDWIVDTRSS